MHHAKEAHSYKKIPSHAFVLPKEGPLAELLQKAFPEAYYVEEMGEWRLDYDAEQFPDQGKRIVAFEEAHGVDVQHRY